MLEADFTAASDRGANAATNNRGEAFQAQFSVDDYGYVGDQQPYQVVYPSYPAPIWMKRYSDLNQALRECRTLCRLEGKPFRLVKWGKPVRSGCTDCGTRPTNRLPDVRGQAMGVLSGLDGTPRIARPVADVHPNGAMEVWDKNGKRAHMVGEQNYVVSPQRAFRGEHKITIPNYFDAVKSAQYLASRSGRKAYVCTRAKCRDGKKWVAVAYVQPGGLSRSNDPRRGPENVITPMTPNMMRQAQMGSRGGNLLGQGS